MALKDNGDEG